MADDTTQQTTDDQTGADNTQQQTQGDGSTGNSDTANDERKFTQADLDNKIGERLKRERKQWEKDAADAAAKAQMTEAEKLKAIADAAEKKATDAQTAANTRIVRAEAKAALASAGVRADRLDIALKTLELSDITVTDDGEPDTAAIDTRIKTLLGKMPEWVTSTATAGGSHFPGGAPGEPPLTREAIAKMSDEDLAKMMKTRPQDVAALFKT